MTIDEFQDLRFGLFVHFGLYSLLGRNEWVMNREEIPRQEYRRLADCFQPDEFRADAIADLAVAAGMKYLVFTTMHHDGFRLYDSDLSDFCSTKTAVRRDFTAEIIAAAKQRGLKIGLYHSLNNWMDQPDGVDALEDKAAYEVFIGNTMARLRELVTRYRPVDLLWYDGWWPFEAEGWRAREMNAMVRKIQPQILINGRNGLEGDFSTPEGHLGAPDPWRPWEACITLNRSWGFSAADHSWKHPSEVVSMLATCAAKQGNLLLNIGPRGDGAVPGPSVDILQAVGTWFQKNGEAIFTGDQFSYDFQHRGEHRGDWNYHGPVTANGNAFYLLVRRWPGNQLTLGGVESKVRRVSLLDGAETLSHHQEGTRLRVEGLPDEAPDPVCTVIKFECETRPSLYQCAGLRVPKVPHPHYDPVASDMLNEG